MDYDTRQILPEEYRNKEERPKRHRDFDRSSDNGGKKRKEAKEKSTDSLMVKKGITNGETIYRPHRFRR